jgi:hypothetical protein
MRKWGIAAGVAVLLIGAFLFMRPFATRDRDVIASTPAAAGVFMPLIPIDVKPKSALCVVDLPLDPESKLARLYLYTFGKPGPPLQIEATSGDAYRYVGRFPGGYKEGQVELPLRPPPQAMRGQICVRNEGTTKLGVQATQVGQRFARPRPFVDAQGLEQDVPMTLHEPGQKSLIEQTPRAIDHAAVFVPLAPWAIWVLLVLALVGIPAGVFFALARADSTTADGAVTPGLVAPPVPFPRARHVVRRATTAVIAAARRVPAVAWLGLLIVVALGFTYLWASRMGTFQNDENQYVYLGRWMAHNLPSSLWNFDLLGRGLQRAEIYVLALTLGTMQPPAAFLVAHFINVAAYVSAAIPMYLLVRGLRARAGWALFAALLTVTGPWLVFAVSFLTEPLAYPAIVWLLWATWRAVVDPRPATQLLAFALLFVALLTRSAFLILVPLLPLVLLAQEVRYGDWSGGAKAVARRLWARHAVVLTVVAAGVFGLLLSVVGILPAPGKLAGGYGTPSVIWGPFLDKTALYASRVVVGTGFLPFAVGLPWLVSQLFRPDDQRTHAFAVTAVAAILLIVYASSPAGPDERYVIYFAPPLFAATALAVSRRRMHWAWVAAGGVIGAVLVYKHGWNPNGGAYGFFVGPAETFYSRVGLLHLQDYLPQGLTLQKGAFFVALAATAVCAYALSRRRYASSVLTALLAGLVLLQLAQGVYNTSKFVTQGGERFGPTHEDRTWVDQAIYGKDSAAIIGLGAGNTPAYDPAWKEVQFWNSSVTSEFASTPLQIQLPPGDFPGSISYDDRTGAASAKPKLPPYAVFPRGYVDLGMAGAPVAHAKYLPADLVKLAQPLQVRFHIDGPAPDGYIEPHKQANIRFFSRGLPSAGRSCGVVPLAAPVAGNGAKETVPYRLGGTRGSVRGGSLVDAQVPLDFRGRPFVDVPLVGERGVTIADKRMLALQVGQINVRPC